MEWKFKTLGLGSRHFGGKVLYLKWSATVKLMDHIKYYNQYAQFGNDHYIYFINGIRLGDDYGRISQLIIKELNNKGI